MIVYSTLSQFCETDDRPRRLLLEAGFQVIENKTGRRIREEEMLAALKEADAVLAAVEPYRETLLAQLPKLKCISRCGAGADAIDLAAAKKLGIAVFATPDEIVEPVAQMAVGMILALLRNFLPHKSDFLEGLWKKRTGWLLSEVVIGLVGFGKVGRKVEEYLSPFHSKVLVADPYLPVRDIPGRVELCDLTPLLKRSDVVSLHAARPPQEGCLIGPSELMTMKRGSFLINTARGYLIDESALEESLRSGHLGGAGLDVFAEEPCLGSVARHPNVVATPHVATLTRSSRSAMEWRAAQNIIDFFEQRKKSGENA